MAVWLAFALFAAGCGLFGIALSREERAALSGRRSSDYCIAAGLCGLALAAAALVIALAQLVVLTAGFTQ